MSVIIQTVNAGCRRSGPAHFPFAAAMCEFSLGARRRPETYLPQWKRALM